MERNFEERTAPIDAVSRLRMAIDGDGITTLVCFHGCPLRCKWCINSFCFQEHENTKFMTPRSLLEQVSIDALYYLATGGGITFGGGEPLLYPWFLAEFRRICNPRWHICAETSLSVPWENVEAAAKVIDAFFVDCKDTDPEIYRRYTGKDNALMLRNLERLIERIGPDRVTVRLPLIPEFNTEEDRERSKQKLLALGVKNFDCFSYIIKQQAVETKQSK